MIEKVGMCAESFEATGIHFVYMVVSKYERVISGFRRARIDFDLGCF